MSRNKPASAVLRAAAGIAVFAFLAACAHADQTAPADPTAASKDPIVVNGDQVEYFHEKKQVVGTGNVSITYKDIVLTCDRITVYLDTREGLAEGNVKVRQKDAYFTGDKMLYNFDTRKGSIDNGYVNAYPMFGRAQHLEKAPMKDEFALTEGSLTTCDLPNPHYRIRAKQVKVFLNDRIEAKDIIVYLGNTPVFYWPYYTQPLKDRKTHVTIIPGEGKDWGYYVLTAYRYYLNERSKGDILLDYRTKKGLAEGINHYLNTEKVGDGAFKFYYTHENDQLAWDPSGEIRNRYRYQYRHRWDMKDVDSYLIAEVNKLSDRDVIKDYFYNEYEELGDVPDNYISLITAKRDYTSEFLVRFQANNFNTVVQRLPEYKINMYNYKIGNTQFYYNGQLSGVYLNEAFDNTTGEAQKNIGTVRFDNYNQLSYAARLFKAVSTTPYVGMRETYYSRNRWGDTNLMRMAFNAGVDNQVKFYKVYDVTTNWAGLEINKLRHIITPMANYYFVHQPTISPDNLNQFDAIDAIDTQNGVFLGIENRLQTKRGSPGNMKSVDLATLLVGTDYMFRLEKNNWNMKSNKFKSVDLQLELIPYSWAYLVAKMSVNTKKYTVQSGSVDLVMSGGEKWQLVFGTRTENTETEDSTLISLDASYRFNKNWKVRAYERWNATKGCFEEMEYTIYRDLHCWVAEFIYDIKDNMANHQFWLVMRLKAFPDYPVGFRRTLSRPRFGEAGTTQ